MRSLADDLRSRTDDELAALLRARPDVTHPVPADLGALAQRAASPASIGMRLRAYDEVHLQILLLCALAEEPLSLGPLAAPLAEAGAGRLSATEARRLVRDALDMFRRDALLWGPPRALHVVGAVRELLVPLSTGPLLAGIDPVVAGYVREPDSLRRLIADMPVTARGALDRLLERPVVGIVVNPRRVPDAARSGVDWLLAHHLVVPFGADRVVVPGEVVALVAPHAAAPARGGSGSGPTRIGGTATTRGAVVSNAPRITGPPPAPGVEPAAGTRQLRVPELLPPRPARQVTNPQRAESGAVGALIDALHAVDEVGHLWAEEPPSRLRTGGVSTRDLSRTARAIGAGEVQTCLLLEVAAAAGLLANDNHELSTVLPTTAFDAWRAQPPALRMAQLLVAWRDMPRSIGTASGETVRPLSDGLLAPHLPTLRAEVLAALAADDGDWSAAELLDALRWRAPRLDWVAREPDVVQVLAQLRRLGVLVGGWLTSAGQALVRTAAATDQGAARSAPATRAPAELDGSLAAVAAALKRVLPDEVDSVIVQGDLTAVVPGLPSTRLADLLRRTARVESRGAASVYRFSADSVRRALDRGATAGQLLTELGRYGPVPQPLAYLVADTARTHATLRVGPSATYLRCDDAAALAAILADPRAAGLGLVALSESVAVSSNPPEQVLEQLRGLGHHPVPDSGGGLAVPPVRRARTPRPPLGDGGPSTMNAATAGALVRALRAADRDGDGPNAQEAPRPTRSQRRSADTAPGPRRTADPTGAGSGVRATDASEVLSVLRGAISDERRVSVDYVSPEGVGTTTDVVPLGISGGYLTALTVPGFVIETFSLARISGVEVAAEDPSHPS